VAAGQVVSDWADYLAAAGKGWCRLTELAATKTDLLLCFFPPCGCLPAPALLPVRPQEVWVASERTKREAWMAEQTRSIKEATIKGLEPEIQVGCHNGA